MIRPRLDPLWVRWLWGFARSSRPRAFHAGVAALLGLTRRTLDELDAMREAGVEFEEHRAGLLAVARTAHGLEWFDLVFAELKALGFEGGMTELGPGEARALEPALGPGAERAVHATLDRHVDPLTLTAGLRDHLVRSGATITTGFVARSIERDGGRWLVRASSGATARARPSWSQRRPAPRRCCARTGCASRWSVPRATRSPFRTTIRPLPCRSTSASRSWG